jgi:hypothetical protein
LRVAQTWEDSQFAAEMLERASSDRSWLVRDQASRISQTGAPAGGLFTGAEVVKTAEQQAIWGGTVGAQFDPCYHLACDTFANNNDHALDVNADAIGFAALTFAYSTETVNGVPGQRVPGQGRSELPAPAGTQGTCPVNPPLPASCP